MPDGDPLLDDLAGAVLDGAAVDWMAAESSADPARRVFVRDLRLVSSIVQVHHNLQLAWNDPLDPVPQKIVATPDRWGHLRLLEWIGRGAFGEVFRAWDTRLDREVALKLLPAAPSSHSETESSIIREGRLLAKVRHPNVITIYGAEQIGDRVGIWMEFVRGQTLEHLLQQGTVFQSAEVVETGVDVCRAVSAVHAAGVLHRDTKAHNVTRGEDGRVVLMDFGTGRELEDNTSSDLTRTPLYVAPEVLAGKPATIQSEVYSLGVLLYHLATGSYPVRGRTIREVRLGHEHGERIAVRTARPGLRPALARVLERAIDPQPEFRYENVDALARDLLALRRRPGIVLLQYGLAATAAILLVALLASEIRARVTGDQLSLATRLAGLVARAPSPVERPAIAVLPLKNLGTEAASDLVVDGITAGLIRQLAIIDGVQVRSQTSSFMLRNKPRNLADIGQRLGVNLVVEGDAQLSEGMLRIHAALVTVEDDTLLWSDTIDRRIGSEGDIVEVTEDLTRTIVNRLRLKLGRTARRYDTDIATVQAYLRARALRDKRGRHAVDAISLFEEVIRRDPSFAPAQAALAAAYGESAAAYPNAEGTTIAPLVAAALIEPLTQRALEIDPLLAEAHAAMGFLHAIRLRWVDAEASFRRAIDLDPSLVGVYGDFVSSTLLPWGRVDDSLRTLETALKADPLSLDVRRILATVQLSGGLYEDALDNCRQVHDADPTLAFTDNACEWALFFKGDRAKALEALDKFSVGRGGGVKAQIHAINGRRAEAEEIAARFGHLPQRQAAIYGLLGDRDRAFEALERLAAINPMRAGIELTRPEVGLRGDPRVEVFRRKLGFPQ
jgi:TolB-like protein/tetratricopeptide (TPR) repeat protein/predicted Ser/Thr protein kinase